MGWSVGFTSTEQDAPNVHLFTSEYYSVGMVWLEAHITSILDNMGEMDNLREEYQTLLADIRDISRDSGIMDDPDMWDDEDFYGDSVTFWIVQD